MCDCHALCLLHANLAGSSVEWEDEVAADGRKIAAPLVRKQAAQQKKGKPQDKAQDKQPQPQEQQLTGSKRQRGGWATFSLRF
jgi:hypothetical protein